MEVPLFLAALPEMFVQEKPFEEICSNFGDIVPSINRIQPANIIVEGRLRIMRSWREAEEGTDGNKSIITILAVELEQPSVPRRRL